MLQWYDSDNAKWRLNISSIGVANMSFPNPGKLAFSMYNGSQIEWPTDLHSKIMKELNSTDGEFIPCNATAPIVFALKNRKIELKPVDYINRDMPDGKCGLIGEIRNSTEFSFPRVFFRDYCLSINNYDKS